MRSRIELIPRLRLLTLPYSIAARLKEIDLPEDQRQPVTAMTNELIPHVRKVVEMLPLFYALTGDHASTRKMLTFVCRAHELSIRSR